MSGISGLFEIGRLALLANQKALGVTGQNISNANTKGYSRQVPVFEATRPIDSQPGQVGTGVRITEIRRIVDSLLETQINSETGMLGNLEARASALDRIESIFSDTQGSGISQAMNGFFNAVQGLVDNPQGYTERIDVISQGETLSEMISKAASDLSQVREDMDTGIGSAINDINGLASQIAVLNEKISRAEINSENANDYRDERTRLLNDLSGKIDISYFEDDLGQVTVMVGGGNPLVEGLVARSLSGAVNSDNDGLTDIYFDPGSGPMVNITENIKNGSIAGMLNIRDGVVPELSGKLDLLAASITNEVNILHRAGYGLDSTTGNDFFSPLTTTTGALSANSSNASIDGGTILDFSLLSLDDYEVRFTSPSSFDIVNTTDNTTVSTGNIYTSGGNIDFDGIRVVITDNTGAPAAGDIFTISVADGHAGRMSVLLSDPNKVAAAQDPASLPGDNRNALALA
ncbi:MAG: flagellar hook-associated protein FlgK, partial [Nitrospirota bacterium]